MADDRDPIHFMFGRVFRVGRSNGAISGYVKSNLAAGRHLSFSNGDTPVYPHIFDPLI